MGNLSVSKTARLDTWFYKVCMVIARLGLAYLFFTQFLWKMPPSFGCGPNYAFPVAKANGSWDANNSSGLCFWMGMESVYASQPRQVLVADMRPVGLPVMSVNITPLAKLNGMVLDTLVIPQIRVFGWFIWAAEVWIFLSMLLGLFTRLGALVSLGVITELYIGLANIPSPYEWEWSYGAIIFLSVAMLAAAAGRTLGLDGLFRSKLAGPAGKGNFVTKIVLLLS